VRVAWRRRRRSWTPPPDPPTSTAQVTPVSHSQVRGTRERERREGVGEREGNRDIQRDCGGVRESLTPLPSGMLLSDQVRATASAAVAAATSAWRSVVGGRRTCTRRPSTRHGPPRDPSSRRTGGDGKEDHHHHHHHHLYDVCP
jgi:hypothetical protein